MKAENYIDSAPTVSIIVPCRNERMQIESCLASILAQESPSGGFEVIVADGLSSDGTRQILQKFSRDDARVRVIDNPHRTTPFALNAAIKNARGRYITIMGAHTEYARRYVVACLELLKEHPEACCSGGPIISVGKGIFGRAVAAVMSNPVGIGNAKHRIPDYEGYAEGACFPTFRREIFDKVGLFDVKLTRNQDDDLNYRISRGGGKIYISPRAQCTYYVRESPVGLFRQYFQYGYWRVAVLRKHRVPASLRQLIPAGFLVLTVVALLGGLFLQSWWRLISIALPTTYACILAVTAAGVAIRHRVLASILFPMAAVIMHFAYATGFITGLVHMGRNQTRNCTTTGGIYSNAIGE